MISAVLILAYLSFSLPFGISQCPDGTFSGITPNKCYFVPPEPKAFLIGEEICQRQNGDLTSIASAFENNDLIGIFYKKTKGSLSTFKWHCGRSGLDRGE